MSVTTTAGTPPPTNTGNGYGDLDQPRRPNSGNRLLLWIAAAIALAVAGVVAFLVFSGGDPEPEASPATTTATTARSSSTTVEETTSITEAAPPVSIEINGWQLTNDDEGLPDYATAPIIYDEGTIEGDIELGFVNSEIASIRSAANPTAEEEPALTFWKTGFTLRAARQVREILAEDGQALLPGAADRLEIENHHHPQ